MPEVLRLPNGEALPLRTNTARAPHGSGHLAQTEAPTPCRASVCAPSDQHQHAHEVARP